MASTPTPSGTASDTPDTAAEAAADSALKAPPATATAQAASTQGGLATPDQVIELADRLSACADQIHERIMREIRAYSGRPVPDKVQATARALLEDEVLLRQRANGLYTDAATFIVKGLGKPQAQLVKLTTDAAEKIRRIGVLGEVTSLVGGLLALAGAAATGQVVPVLLAVEKVEKHTKALDALAPAKPLAKPPAKAG